MGFNQILYILNEEVGKDKTIKVKSIEITKEVNGLQYLKATLEDGSMIELGLNSEIPFRAEKLRENGFVVKGKCTYTLED